MTASAMRRRIVAGNWKMYTTTDTGAQLAREVVAAGLPYAEVDVVLCPPTIGIAAVAGVISDTPIRLGVQNVHWEDAGAFTGEVSPSMLQGVAGYVIVGHSERRAMFGDTDEIVGRKVTAVVAHDLTPIMCLGESLAQRDAGETETVIASQAAAGLAGLTDGQVARAIVAYEPIWAIGTGRNATTQQAVEAIGWIRDRIRREFGEAAAGAVRIQYGGSVNPQNCDSLFESREIDGALVGGASLDAGQFAAIVRAAAA